MLVSYEVGKTFPVKVYDGPLVDLKEDGFHFVLGGESWNDEEVLLFKHSPVRIDISHINKIIFFLIEINYLTNVCDCPFHIKLSTSTIEEIEEGKGYGMYMYLVDTVDNKLKAIRLISFTTEFSRLLNSIIKVQESNAFDIENYDNSIKYIYKNFTGEELRKFSTGTFRTNIKI